MALPVINEGTLAFSRFNGPQHLVAQYPVDFSVYSSAIFTPTGVDPQAVQRLPQQAAGVSIDNSTSNTYCVVQCGTYVENIPPYTKATISIGINVSQVAVSGTSGVVLVTFYTGSFPGTEIATNQLGANKGAILPFAPPGELKMYAGLAGNIPDGYLICQGQPISRIAYAQLFNAIGTIYGAGDGSSTFNVPNLVGAVVIGATANNGAYPIGAKGGEATHILAPNEMPQHVHTTLATGGTYGVGLSGGGYNLGGGGSSSSFPDLSTFQTGSSGGNAAHNNMPPYVAMCYIIKT